MVKNPSSIKPPRGGFARRFEEKWSTKKIGDVARCAAGGTPSTLISEYWNGDIRWMNSGDLKRKFVKDVRGRITELGLSNSSTKMLPKKCVLIALAGQGKTRGKVAVNLVPLSINQSIAAIFPNKDFCPFYLYYNLENRYGELRAISSGDTGRGALTLHIIKNLTVAFPCLKEQNAIAEVLADIDSWIESLRRLVQKKRDIKTAAMQELLTGKTRLPGFTGKWGAKPLGSIVKFHGKGLRPASFATPSGSVPFIISSENEKMCAVADFDFEALIIGDGGYANVHYKNTPFSASDHTYILTTDDEIAVLQYVYFFLAHNLELIEAGFKGIGVRNISKNYIKEIAIPLPPIAEQAAIANLLADMDADIVAQERLLEKAENVKIATMQELLTGKTRLPANQ